MKHLTTNTSWSNISCPDIQQPPLITGVSTVVNEEQLNIERLRHNSKHFLKNKRQFHKHEEISKEK